MSKITCLHCNKAVDLKPGQCVLYLFTRQPWFSYIELLCPKCAQITKPFLGPHWEGWVVDCEQHFIPRVTEEWAPQDLIDECNKVFGIKMLIPQQLGPRHERQIAFLHYLLEKNGPEVEFEAS